MRVKLKNLNFGLILAETLDRELVSPAAVVEPMRDARHGRGTDFLLVSDLEIRKLLIHKPRDAETIGHLLDLMQSHQITKEVFAFFDGFELENGLEKLAGLLVFPAKHRIILHILVC